MRIVKTLIKLAALGLAVAIILGLIGGVISLTGIIDFATTGDTSNLMSEMTTVLEEKTTVRELDVEVKASVVEIRSGDVLKVETNCNYIQAEVQDGKLTIAEREQGLFGVNGTGQVRIALPEEALETVRAKVGAGVLKMSLIGSAENYEITVKKGLGSVTLNGQELKDGETVGKGRRKIAVELGAGMIEMRTEK